MTYPPHMPDGSDIPLPDPPPSLAASTEFHVGVLHAAVQNAQSSIRNLGSRVGEFERGQIELSNLIAATARESEHRHADVMRELAVLTKDAAKHDQQEQDRSDRTVGLVFPVPTAKGLVSAVVFFLLVALTFMGLPLLTNTLGSGQ